MTMDWRAYWDAKASEDLPSSAGRSSATPAQVFALLLDAARALRLKWDDRLLEVGCGRGLLGRHLTHVCVYHGIDISYGQVAAGWPPADWLRVKRADVSEHAPYSAESFDKVLCASVLQYLPAERVPLALAEMRHVIKPGGLCFVAGNPNKAQQSAYLEGLEKAPLLDEEKAKRRKLNLAATWFMPEELAGMAERSGWRALELRTPDGEVFQSSHQFDLLLEAR